MGAGQSLIIVDYALVLNYGLNQINKDAENELKTLRYFSSEAVKKADFLKTVIIINEALVRLAHRYALLAREMASKETDATRKKELDMIAGICDRVPGEPARNFREAMQSFWFTWSMIAQGTTPGGRFDQFMYPFYRKEMSAADVFRDVNADAVFYGRSGGGVTISGGEPLAQPDFTLAILKLCRQAGLSTALDTCGHAEWVVFREILPYVDIVLYDFKHLDPTEHQRLTGVSNELILENARRIIRQLPDITFLARVPVVPDYNDDAENIAATARFVIELGTPVKVHLLPYHRLGETKYERLEKSGICKITPPAEEHMEELHRIFESFGLKVAIGG